jgi:hypothetical protein
MKMALYTEIVPKTHNFNLKLGKKKKNLRQIPIAAHSTKHLTSTPLFHSEIQMCVWRILALSVSQTFAEESLGRSGRGLFQTECSQRTQHGKGAIDVKLKYFLRTMCIWKLSSA